MKEVIHYRRCHLCGHLNSVEDGKVETCHHCQKSLAPFFYFDDKYSAVHGDNFMRPQLMFNEYAPILGLTVHWEGF